MNKSRNVRRALMLFSVTLVGNQSGHAFFNDPLFPFNDFFYEQGPAKSRATAEKDLAACVKNLQDEAKRLTTVADKLAQQLEKKDEAKDGELQSVFDTIQDCQVGIQEAFSGIRRNARSARQAQRAEEIKKIPSYSLRTYKDDKKNKFIVTASLPDKTKEDLKITVKTTDEFGQKHRTLQVETKPQKETKSSPSGFFSSSSVTHAQYINGRREELVAENGNISITVDLPPNANSNLAEVQKTMTLENGVLTLSFPLSEPAEKETELKFTTAAATTSDTSKDK